jgi:hypothetical protein
MTDLYTSLGRLAILAMMVSVSTGCRSTTQKLSQVIGGGQRDIPKYVDGPGVAEPTTDPAELCFADTHFYARFKELAEHNDPQTNPFAEQAAEILAPINADGLLDRAAKKMGCTKRELFDRFFGIDVAMIDRMHDKNSPIILMSRASDADLARLPDAIGATIWKEAPTTGGYQTYVFAVSNDSQGLLAIGKNWFFVCERQHVDALRKLLRRSEQPRQTLARLPAYRDFRNRANKGAFGFAWGRAKARDYHGAAAVRIDEGYDLGIYSEVERPPPPPGDDPYPFLAQRHKLDFGPLPQNVAFAGALNSLHRKPKDLGILDIPLIFSSVRTTILPGVEPPLIGVVADAPAPEFGTNARAPVLAICTRVTDDKVAEAIDSMLRNFHFLASLGALEFKKSLFGFKTRTFEGVNYQVADFGDGIIDRLPEGQLLPLVDLPKPAGLRALTMGRIGEWYVLCSQEKFFQDCVTASQYPNKRWTASAKFAEFAVHERPQLLASFAIDAPKVGDVVENATTIYEKARASKAEGKPAAAEEPPSRSADAEHPLKRLDDVMHTISDIAHQISSNWLRMHTVSAEDPKAKEQSTIGEKKRESAATKPEDAEDTKKALEPLRWVSDALRRHHSLAAQFWRGEDGNPEGTVRLLVRE